jgi:hypothetical protein
MKDGPRCLQPMQKYETRRPWDELDTQARRDPDPVCWRPKGHPPGRHVSRASYERMREHERHRRGLARAGMSDPGETVAA